MQEMIRDTDADKVHEAQLEKAMFLLWQKESGESNDIWIEHLKKCVRVASREALTEKQRISIGLYLSGYNIYEIAEIRGVSATSVSRTIKRGLNQLLSRIKYATPRTLSVEGKVRKRLNGLYRKERVEQEEPATMTNADHIQFTMGAKLYADLINWLKQPYKEDT